MSGVLYCVVSHTITNNFSSLQNSIMTFGPINPIDPSYGQFVLNSTHPRNPLCSVGFGHIARGSDDLSEARTNVRSIISPYGRHFLKRITTQLTGNPLGSEFEGIQ
ncbi:hypothetical protein AVEN_216342-1 [Araneus ventricosus]|uniref:Uncharacterized protein n=1 Tax=Araneus ventricosus TaxID=182803 RepID=A0A4Y2WL40_ARAVE|nr:hypothetical protein AVEN_216342-1 [Araneus ventricosus]